MAERVTIKIDGVAFEVAAGASVAAVLFDLGRAGLRRSPQGQPRGALCGMGTCFECRIRVDGRVVRACLELCRAGLEVELDG
jgi:aerobic-type carbon monoxide dehydrogenase small subunit (CoxS/CutS family)